MRQYSFTASELYCMAYIMNKTKVYGVADDIGSDIEMSIHKIIDTLVEKGIAIIDIDGCVSVANDYREIVDFVSNCQNCITINAQKNTGASQSIIIWKYNSRYLMAELDSDRYIMVSMDEYTLKSLIQSMLPMSDYEAQVEDVIIPLMELIKGKRMCNDEAQSDIGRILKQNGVADVRISKLIADGLMERADYLGILHMDMNIGECQKEEVAFLFDRNAIFEINQLVVNFHTSVCFSTRTAKQVEKKVLSIVDAFINGYLKGETI